MKPVLVLGTGQLSCMLRLAGKPLSIRVYPVGWNSNYTDLPISTSVITTEIEHWPKNILTNKLMHHPEFINRDIFPRIVDRFKQKQLFDQLNLATAPWKLLSDKSEWPQIFNSLGLLAIVKCRVGGYDGRRQWRFHNYEIISLPDEYYGQCIIEKAIKFTDEVSLIGARGQDGKIVFYPLTYNLHQSGILRASLCSPKVDAILQQQAETMLSTIMHYLNYIGVMVMECFITPQGLLINEVAPRVHNSGHWTQNGASISQFELHLRAILGLPLPKPIVFSSSVMINLIGIPINLLWLDHPLVHLHWYGKEIHTGRKVGHLNMTDVDQTRLIMAVKFLLPLLPKEYNHTINWITKNYKLI